MIHRPLVYADALSFECIQYDTPVCVARMSMTAKSTIILIVVLVYRCIIRAFNHPKGGRRVE